MGNLTDGQRAADMAAAFYPFKAVADIFERAEGRADRLTRSMARILAESDGLRENAPPDAYRPWMRHARLAVSYFEGVYEAEIGSLREKLSNALAANGDHRSDCAVFNAPAYEPGPCDCGATHNLAPSHA